MYRPRTAPSRATDVAPHRCVCPYNTARTLPHRPGLKGVQRDCMGTDEEWPHRFRRRTGDHHGCRASWRCVAMERNWPAKI